MRKIAKHNLSNHHFESQHFVFLSRGLIDQNVPRFKVHVDPAYRILQNINGGSATIYYNIPVTNSKFHDVFSQLSLKTNIN